MPINGVLIGFLLTDLLFRFLAWLGPLSLPGMLISYGIVRAEEINLVRKSGKPLQERSSRPRSRGCGR
ncbi:hypothetical protein AB1E33_05585 [Ruegeria sp. 2012CJ15-1]